MSKKVVTNVQTFGRFDILGFLDDSLDSGGSGDEGNKQPNNKQKGEKGKASGGGQQQGAGAKKKSKKKKKQQAENAEVCTSLIKYVWLMKLFKFVAYYIINYIITNYPNRLSNQQLNEHDHELKFKLHCVLFGYPSVVVNGVRNCFVHVRCTRMFVQLSIRL